MLECEVFSASDFQVSWGINAGDAMGLPGQCALGDIYTLNRDAAARRLLIDTRDTPHLLQDLDGTPPLASQGPVRPIGRLRLMSADGDGIEAIILDISGRLFLLPRRPMRTGIGYAVIDIDSAVDSLQAAGLTLGSFTSGTRITVADGRLVPVETLQPGTPILTRDHGAQPLRWVGQVTLRAYRDQAPVQIPAGVFGNLRSLSIAPRQRIFLYQRTESRIGSRAEVLIQAQYLVGSAGITWREGGFVTYFSLVFDEHQIIYAEGVPMESLLVSRANLTQLPQHLAHDLEKRFPSLNQHAHFAQDLTPAQTAGLPAQALPPDDASATAAARPGLHRTHGKTQI